jgi:hypothetical protein
MDVSRPNLQVHAGYGDEALELLGESAGFENELAQGCLLPGFVFCAGSVPATRKGVNLWFAPMGKRGPGMTKVCSGQEK